MVEVSRFARYHAQVAFLLTKFPSNVSLAMSSYQLLYTLAHLSIDIHC